MGKIRIKTLGDEEKEKKQKKRDEARREGKKIAKQQDVPSDKVEKKDEPVALAEKKEVVEVKSPSLEVEKPVKTASIKKASRSRSRRYQKVRSFVDKTKTYSLTDAISLVKKTNITHFDATMEVHVNTLVKDIKGHVTLPHGIGKEIKVKIADDKLLSQIESGKIDFDVLVSHPSFMAKLAKVAKILGPRGLMPNPKNGTISEKPEEAVKKFSLALHFKTEADFPLIHTVIGKTSFPDNKLAENLNVLINAIGPEKIKTLYLKATMSPSVKVELAPNRSGLGIVKENNL
ncbi:hypothetical protein HY030_03985 [Candidatus Gottesmanbacteria bacterium]|nr:hypothetical protein [Candidatus Gottesmanbacteria bacterium]